MNLRTLCVCLLLIALALYTVGRAMEEQNSQESSDSAFNQTSWTHSDYMEWDGHFQLLVYREDTPWFESNPWYEPFSGEAQCCPAVPPLGAPLLLDLTVQELLENFI